MATDNVVDRIDVTGMSSLSRERRIGELRALINEEEMRIDDTGAKGV